MKNKKAGSRRRRRGGGGGGGRGGGEKKETKERRKMEWTDKEHNLRFHWHKSNSSLDSQMIV